MSIQAVLLPLFVQVLLTFVLMFGMMYYRMGALRSGETRLSEIAMREPNWPTRANSSPTRSATSSNCRCCSMS